PLTSSAHNALEIARARRAGAALVFLSPVFPTASHPGAPALGPRRWSAMARLGRVPAIALGGVNGQNVRTLPWDGCTGAAALGAQRVVVRAADHEVPVDYDQLVVRDGRPIVDPDRNARIRNVRRAGIAAPRLGHAPSVLRSCRKPGILAGAVIRLVQDHLDVD